MGSVGRFHGRKAASSISTADSIESNREPLDPARSCVEDRVRQSMRVMHNFRCCLCLGVALLAAQSLVAQDPPPASSEKVPPVKTDVQSRITIEVIGGEKDTPVENASAYWKYVEEHKLKKDKKLELNLKTN